MVSIADILEFVAAEDSSSLHGDPSTEVVKPASLARSSPSDLTYVAPAGLNAVPDRLAAAVVIVDRAVEDQLDTESWLVGAIVKSDDARLAFVRLLQRFFEPRRPFSGLHASAIIDPGADIAKDVHIDALCRVANDVTIGSGTTLHAGAVIHPGVRIGRDVVVQSGTTIGSDGFGYSRDKDGRLVRFPHVGGVEIGDRVEIGGNCCIDRGTLYDTVIEAGTCFDNLVHVAHNVHLGPDSVVVAQAFLGPSVYGAGCWIGPSACVLGGLTIGERAFVGGGAVVTRDVPPDTTVAGVPGRDLEHYRAINRALSKTGRDGAGD